MIKAGLAQKFPYAFDWIQIKILDDKTAAHGLWLFKLHYDFINGADVLSLMQALSGYKIAE